MKVREGRRFEMSKNQVFLKAAVMYLIYFVYTYYASSIINVFAPINEYFVRLVLDILFLTVILVTYLPSLKKDKQVLKEKYSTKKIIKVVGLGVLAFIFLNIIMGIITDILFPGFSADQNTQAIQDLASLSMVYTVFKTIIFSVIAEELLFRESLSEAITSNGLFILVTSIIYTAMNFIFATNNTGIYMIAELAIYFIPALLFSYIYVKNDRNIILIMLIKFVYNLIPLTILLLGI